MATRLSLSLLAGQEDCGMDNGRCGPVRAMGIGTLRLRPDFVQGGVTGAFVAFTDGYGPGGGQPAPHPRSARRLHGPPRLPRHGQRPRRHQDRRLRRPAHDLRPTRHMSILAPLVALQDTVLSVAAGRLRASPTSRRVLERGAMNMASVAMPLAPAHGPERRESVANGAGTHMCPAPRTRASDTGPGTNICPGASGAG